MCSVNVVSERAHVNVMRYSELYGNIEKLAEMTNSPEPTGQQVTDCNIDAKMDFYGTYVLLNEQVTLQTKIQFLMKLLSVWAYPLSN